MLFIWQDHSYRRLCVEMNRRCFVLFAWRLGICVDSSSENTRWQRGWVPSSFFHPPALLDGLNPTTCSVLTTKCHPRANYNGIDGVKAERELPKSDSRNLLCFPEMNSVCRWTNYSLCDHCKGLCSLKRPRSSRSTENDTKRSLGIAKASISLTGTRFRILIRSHEVLRLFLHLCSSHAFWCIECS